LQSQLNLLQAFGDGGLNLMLKFGNIRSLSDSYILINFI